MAKQFSILHGMQTLLRLTVLLVLLIGSYSLSQHNHSDLRNHHDCAVCILGVSALHTPTKIPVHFFQINSGDLLLISTAILIPACICHAYSARGPPV